MSKRPKMRVVPMMHRIVMDRFSSMNDFKDFLKNAIQNEHQLLSKRIERASKAYTSEEIEALDDMFALRYITALRKRIHTDPKTKKSLQTSGLKSWVKN